MLLLILLSLFTCDATAQLIGDFEPKPGTTYFTKEALVNDLDDFKFAVATLHIHPFDYIKKEEFFREIDNLKVTAGSCDAEQLLIGLKKINARIQDEHTTISYFSADRFPFNCYWFEEGIYITDASKEYRQQLLHAKIIAINSIPISEVVDSIIAILPDKNRAAIAAYAPEYVIDPGTLHGLGIAPARNNVEYTVLKLNGDTVNVCARAIIRKRPKAYTLPVKKTSLYHTQHPYYWYKYHDTGNYIYFNYAKCLPDPDLPFRKLEDRLIHDIEHNYPDKIIIDLRENTGGYSWVLAHFIKFLNKSDLNRKEKIYVLVGRRTFSAAILDAVDLKNFTRAIIVGEETAGSVSHYGSVKDYFLRHTKLKIMYSTQYVVTTEEYEGSLKPDVNIPVRLSDYLNGTDAALQYAIDH